MNSDELIKRLIPYRLRAVETLNLAIRLNSEWEDSPPMTVHVHGKLVIEGNLNAFTNPAIEAGLVHCRALLEFLGLGEKNGELRRRTEDRRADDVGIERFCNEHGPLKLVDPEEAIARYNGKPEEARDALAMVFQVTNRGLAHITNQRIAHPESGRLIQIASRGVPALVISFLYTPLGLPEPDYKVSSRSSQD